MRLDRFTIRNLELFDPLDPDGKSLLGVIDRTVTPMGARMLRRVLAFVCHAAQAVEFFVDPGVDYLAARCR